MHFSSSSPKLVIWNLKQAINLRKKKEGGTEGKGLLVEID